MKRLVSMIAPLPSSVVASRRHLLPRGEKGTALYAAALALGFFLPLAASAQNLAAEPPRPAVQLDRLQRADGASVVPEKFLRRWDPVTVFFEADSGPASGGPEDDPGRVVTMTPPAAGSWQWLNARTLQFRPAEPWRALQRVEVAAAGKTVRLVPLLPAPTATSPEPSADGIPQLDQFGLTFSEPVDVEALRRLLTVELRPLPGIGGESGQVLGSGDLAEGMAAFGAYIRDASSRTDRLLPLEGVEEVEIRDRNGLLLSTRVVNHPSSGELCLVLLGSADVSVVAAKKIVDEHLRRRQP